MAAELEGASLGLAWAAPFCGILLSIALFPLFAPHFWEHHQGKIAFSWALLALLPLGVLYGPSVAASVFLAMLVHDYLPFIILLFALFTVAGGVVVRGDLHGAPRTNLILLAIGTMLASLIGTTGAAMVMIRPLLRANDDRPRNSHVVVFFIFLVANIGGSLTPLGDPPLFLGFLHGVDFFWTTRHLLPETLFLSLALLAIFFILDSFIYRRDRAGAGDPTPDNPVRIGGAVNLALIGVIVAAILMSGAARLGSLRLWGLEIAIEDLLRDLILLAVAFASHALTPKSLRRENEFSWGPIKEVAKLFAGIFATIIPVLAMLRAGKEGAFAPLVALVTHADGAANPAAYFWASGGLSSFLDNAPTYLVFFNLAGGDAGRLMGAGALTLTAISAGAVFMGANSYIGNAPNFMVYAIARQQGVKMPSFFGYMLWSGGILLPLFALTTILFYA